MKVLCCENCGKTNFTEASPLFIGRDKAGRKHKYCLDCATTKPKEKPHPYWDNENRRQVMRWRGLIR